MTFKALILFAIVSINIPVYAQLECRHLLSTNFEEINNEIMAMRNTAEKWARQAQDNPQRDRGWGSDGTIDSYRGTFNAMVPGKTSFSDLFDQRRTLGLQNHVLDIFGSGTANTVLDSSTSVRLLGLGATQRSALSNRSEISGDAFSDATFRKIDAVMKNAGIPYFNWIFIRPDGGLDSVSKNRAFFISLFNLLEMAYQRLSNKDGSIYVQIFTNDESLSDKGDAIFSSRDWIDWQQLLAGHGIKSDFSYGTHRIGGYAPPSSGRIIGMRIVKNQNSPTDLPWPKRVEQYFWK